MSEDVHNGGCQCGAVRFRFKGKAHDASICHCRMCQKAFGNYFAPLVSTRGLVFAWTRGKPKWFRSSNYVERGFCGECGTPLAYRAPDGLAVSCGALDEPERLPPVVQYGVEGKLSFVDHLHELKAMRTEDDLANAPFLNSIRSYQHPDRDTERWPEGAAK